MRRVAASAISFGALVLAACQPPPAGGVGAPGSASSSGADIDVGSVSFELTLGGGYRIGAVSYDISGNGFHRAADVSVANSTTFQTVVGDIPLGNGYTATLTVQDLDHKLLPCQGSSMFSVTSAATVPVDVHLACKPVPKSIVPVVPVPRWAAFALAALLLALGWRRARRAGARSALVLAAATSLSLAATGCDASAVTPSSDPGTVTMALDLAPGTTLNAVDYQVMGPGAFMTSGTIDVSHSSTISTTLSPLPPGTGFQIDLRATSADGTARCTGSATFDVAARSTTDVLVHLLCQQMPRNGSVAINGAFNACPSIDSLAATPAEVFVGATLALQATAHDLDHAPAPLTYQWSTTSGTLSDAAAQNPQFLCTSSGPATITLTVSDGDGTSGCPDTQALTVVCTAATP